MARWGAFFFFQAEDGIRDFHVTGVQTCALPICQTDPRLLRERKRICRRCPLTARSPLTACPPFDSLSPVDNLFPVDSPRSEERRVGKEGGARAALERQDSNSCATTARA